ncbi:MAG: hypothetical protein H7197_00850 [Vitreoscilla sp.]|nr:hypothetical protein [Polaromonas sp.]
MPFVRALALLLLVITAVLFLFYAATGQMRYKNWGMVLLKWTLLAGFGFFAVLIFQRLTT